MVLKCQACMMICGKTVWLADGKSSGKPAWKGTWWIIFEICLAWKNNGKPKGIIARYYLQVATDFNTYKALSSPEASIPFNITPNKLSFNSCLTSFNDRIISYFAINSMYFCKPNFYKCPSYTDSKMCLLKMLGYGASCSLWKQKLI